MDVRKSCSRNRLEKHEVWSLLLLLTIAEGKFLKVVSAARDVICSQSVLQSQCPGSYIIKSSLEGKAKVRIIYV